MKSQNQTFKKQQTSKPESIPKNLLKPFKTSYTKALFITRGSSLILFYILFMILQGKLYFTLEQLKNIIPFTFNIIFVFAAFVLTIFVTHEKIKSHPQKDKILLDYIGQCLFLISISIFVYIMSYLITPKDNLASSILFYTVLVVLWLNMTKLLFIIRYFFNPYEEKHIIT